VVAGTAGAVNHHQDEKYAQQDAAAQQQQAEQPAPPAPQQASAQDELFIQLQQLAQLNDTGVLTDEEFARAARGKLLPG
jgi:hypothetical protein